MSEKAVIRFLQRRAGIVLGAALLLLIIVVAAGAGVFAGSDPLDLMGKPYLWPGTTSRFPLGTDMLGRDMWSGIAHGARISLLIGVAAGFAAAAFGTLVGCIAGYYGGWADNVLMRVTELFQVMPPLVFTIVLVVILEPSVGSIVLGISATSWPVVARLARGEASKLRKTDFVQAALVMGMPELRIVATHILPNAISPVAAMLSMLVGHAILTEAALAFLGLGDPNAISWGSMIGAGREELRAAWYMSALPGAAIFITVAALAILGSGINDWINPRRGKLR